MSILVVGSVAFDSIETPHGKVENILGGSANYFSLAASYFCPVKMVGIVGRDYPKNHFEFLKTKNICIRGVEVIEGKTFHWSGRYTKSLSEAETLSTCLNVFEKFSPKLPPGYEEVNYVFLANIDPSLQKEVLAQVKKPKLVIGDTMNFWIRGKNKELLETLKQLDILLINETEARLLVEEDNLIKVGRKILTLGPKVLVIKRGEYGALLMKKDLLFFVPAYPVESIFDPTGAGDSFAGGFVGYLAKNEVQLEDQFLKRALFYGTVLASFSIEDFGFTRLKYLNSQEIERRREKLVEMISH